MTDEVLRLPLICKEKSIILDGENGEEKKYTLRELTGTQRNIYLNKMTKRVKIRDGKAIGINSFDGFQSDLLCNSLLDENGDLVLKEEIEGMPSSTQQTLFEESQKISSLEDQDDKGNEDPND